MDLLPLNYRLYETIYSQNGHRHEKTFLCCIVDYIDQRISNYLSGKHDTMTYHMRTFKLLGSVCIAKQADMWLCNALRCVHSSFAIILKRKRKRKLVALLL